MTLLSARALTVRIGETHVCEGLDFDLEPGQRWALLGGNGAGKTTLLHTLAGLRAPVAGSIHAAGIDLRIWNRKSLARRLGMLFQDSRDTMPGTVLETALTGRYPHLPLWAIEGEEDFRIAESALRDVELWTMRSRRVDTLSGGERRRLAIAVLLVQSPQVMSATAVPSAFDPVRMSCMFGVSPRPLTAAPVSVSPVCLLIPFASLCSSATSLAISSPFALCHGPPPMRSRASTVLVLR